MHLYMVMYFNTCNMTMMKQSCFRNLSKDYEEASFLRLWLNSSTALWHKNSFDYSDLSNSNKLESNPVTVVKNNYDNCTENAFFLDVIVRLRGSEKGIRSVLKLVHNYI